MKLKTSTLAQIYFALKGLENQTFESFSLSYRIGRNIDMLSKLGEKFVNDIRTAAGDGPINQEAEFKVFTEWDADGKEESFDLKMLSFEGEKNVPSPALLRILMPILENED